MDTFEFDLQLFADEESETVEVTIPDELAGISEDVAREIMTEADYSEDAEVETEVEEEVKEDTIIVEANNENNTEESEDSEIVKTPSQNIPYKRFKEVVDKRNDLEKQLEAYKARFGDVNAPEPQKVEPTPEPVQKPATINDDAVQQIEAAIKAEAMAITGFTADDVDALEYEDEGSSKTARWGVALSMARNKVYTAIAQAQQKQERMARELLDKHNASVASFNQFYMEQKAEADFNEVQQYAINDYFSALGDDDKRIIAEANARYTRGTCSEQDLYCLKRYFTDAKNAYRAKTGKKGGNAKKTISKIEQASKFPRVNSIDGTTTNGAVTISALEDMLTNKRWDEIPKEYQDILQGIS